MKNCLIDVFLLIFITFLPLFFPYFTFAQSPQASPTAQLLPTATAAPAEDYFENLVGAIEETDLDQQLEDAFFGLNPRLKINHVSPPTPTPSDQTGQGQVDQRGVNLGLQAVQPTPQSQPLFDTSGYYVLNRASKDRHNPVAPVSLKLGDYFKLFLMLLDLLGIRDIGNKEALELLTSYLPYGVGEMALSKLDTPATTALSQNSPNVLGVKSKEAMLCSLPMLKRASLPGSASLPGCDESGTVEDIPEVDSDVSPTFGPSPTPGLSGNYDLGICSLGVNKCSPEYLRDVLKNDLNVPETEIDEIKVKNASQICMQESAGNPFALNDGCDADKYPDVKDRSQDYSVGLFQINMLVSSLCPGALKDDWENSKSCAILAKDKLDQCVDKYREPVENIAFAWNLSGHFSNFGHWKGNAIKCQIPPHNISALPDRNYIYYSQRAGEYATDKFDDCNISRGGCGPVTVAMILSTYVNGRYDPNWVITNEEYNNQPYCASSMSEALSVLARNGFSYDKVYSVSAPGQKLSSDWINELINYQKAGSQFIALAKICNIGHFFWITDVSENGDIYVMDPWYGYNRIFPMLQDAINCDKLYIQIYAFHKST